MNGILRNAACLMLIPAMLAGGIAARAGEKRDENHVTALVVLVTGLSDQGKSRRLVNPAGPVELLPVHGKPMIAWVLDALRSARTVKKIVVVGAEDTGTLLKPNLRENEIFVSAGGSVSDRLEKGIEHAEGLVLVVPPDIVLVKPDAVDRLARKCLESPGTDVFYPMVAKQICEEKYPWEKRTYVSSRGAR